ncbi:GGDEF domain-containing protein [Longispora sp. K20-0274]|uniref:diguanylate cyclase domain-containing protein n=1 Tax=Longispora sp. K20-0274 TaxID=3088255 RepID=UPI00399A7863
MAVPVAGPGRRWASHWWSDGRLAALTVGVGALTLWYLADTSALRAQNLLCWLALLVLHGWAVSLAPGIARRAVTPAHRRLWRWVTAALACFVLGDVAQLAAILTGPLTITTVTGVPAQVTLLLAGIAVLAVGMLITPLGFTTPRERLRFWFDLGTVMAAGLAWGFYVAARPALDVRSVTGLVGPPVLFLVELFAITKLVFSREPPLTRTAGTLVLAAVALETTIQSAAGPFWVQHNQLNLLLVGAVVSSALATAAVEVQARQLPPVAGRRGPGRRRFSLLPYAAIASVYVILVLTLVGNGLDLRAWAAVAGAFLCTLLVVVRQVLAFLDNERLVTELSAEVGRRQRLAAALHHQAYHDRLTGLGNRALFTEYLDEAVAGAGETAVIVLDLDDFKPVNDRYGHRAGDELLVAIAARLRGCVRDTDVLARLGGDEFGVVVAGPDRAVVTAIAERIVAAVAEPFPVAGRRLVVGASVGAVIDSAGRHTADALLHAADSAMYAAKKGGKNSARVVTVDEPDPPRARA